MQIAPAGDNALLVELGDVSASTLHAAAVSVLNLEQVLACVPGHASLYVICAGSPDEELIASAIRSSRVTEEPLGTEERSPVMRPATVHRARVSFSHECAPDLAEFLARVAITRDELLDRVAHLRLTARYLGFRGGFAYLDGWPPEWSMPRRPTSRPVPRGTFAIAGSVAAFYPIESPGGWNLLGRTDTDFEHAIEAGDQILLEPTLEPLAPPPGATPRALALDFAEVVAAPLARIVSRSDWSGVARGLAPGGAFDELAAALANSAVGNEPTAPLVECALAGPRLRFHRDSYVSWCGPDLEVMVRRVRNGDEVAFGRVKNGMRAYIAAGDQERALPRVARENRLVIRAVRGPHDIGVSTVECEVTPQLDRVGIRLRPLEPIHARIPDELPSCGMQCGTIQLHPDSSLVVMGPDHPVTGGYLQPLTVITSERWKLAQLVPGERLRIEA